jgi:hypothetical protein
MIIVITVAGHEYTFKSFRDGTYGFAAPKLHTMTYEQLFFATRVPRATYLFTDLDRLAPWELRLAGDLYRRMRKAKLACLNNPARAMSRMELLRALHLAGINPFDVYRADEQPRPKRFPVFIRPENSHYLAEKPALLEDQAALDAALEDLRRNFIPLRGALVIEFCPAPYNETLWCKWSAFRVADRMSVDHAGVDNHWFVKHGVWQLLTDTVVADEFEAVKTNRFAADLKKAFEIGGIEFGRADYGVVDGRPVIYEINTNPQIGHFMRSTIPGRTETRTLARQRLAAALYAIDCKESGTRKLKPPLPVLRKGRRLWSFGSRVPLRP